MVLNEDFQIRYSASLQLNKLQNCRELKLEVQKTDRYERVKRNGQKQQHAYNWLKENVHDVKIANDKEDEIIKQVNDREDAKWYAKQDALQDRHSRMVKSLRDFKVADQEIKANR